VCDDNTAGFPTTLMKHVCLSQGDNPCVILVSLESGSHATEVVAAFHGKAKTRRN
jgi:hypothetical protein